MEITVAPKEQTNRDVRFFKLSAGSGFHFIIGGYEYVFLQFPKLSIDPV